MSRGAVARAAVFLSVIVVIPMAAAAEPTRPLAPAEVAAVDGALGALPPPLRAGLHLAVRTDRRCVPGDPFAAVEVDPGARAVALCEGASAEELAQQSLFGAFMIFDEQAGWSRAPAWRRLNGWGRQALGPWRWTAQNEAPGATAAPSGRRSPAWDLATFAAAWVAERLAAPGAQDPPLTCRLLPQARLLHARLRDLGALAPGLRAPPACAAFERWAQRDRIERLEINLAMPSTVTMASMFGHVFLRFVQRGTTEAVALDDRTVAFLVENPLPVTEERLYALKGIAGAYQASVLERSFLDTYRTYVVAEGRDLRRFRLNLSPGETDALLARLWSLTQAGRYRYTFFAANCATLMVALLNSVLPDARQIRYPEALATTPAGTLEGYAQAIAADGGPLTTFIPETILSFEHEARQAARARAQVAMRLEAATAATARAHLGAVLRAALGGSAEERAAAYGRLVKDGPPARELRLFLRQSALVETHLSALANLEAEEALYRQRRARLRATLGEVRGRLARRSSACAPALGEALAATARDEVDARLPGYRALRALLAGACAAEPGFGDELRRLALLEAEVRFDHDALEPGLRDALLFPERDRTLGEQPFVAASPGLAVLLDYPHVTRVAPALLAVQAAARALGPPEAEGDPTVLRAREDAARREAEAAAYANAVGRTGIDELEVGGTVSGARGLLVIGGALHDERLGDQRRFGFAAHTALTVVRTQTALAWDAGGPRLAAWEARVLGYRSLPLARPPSGSRVGGELAFDVGGRPRQGRALEARIAGGWVLPLLASESLADHLLVTLGPALALDRRTAGLGPSIWGLGAAAGIEGRLAPARDQGLWLAARALVRPLWTTAGPARELVAAAELRLPLVERLPLPGGAARALTLRLGWALAASTLRLGPALPRLDQRLSTTVAFE